MSGSDRPAIVRALREGGSFLVLLHELPDGDSVGATLAMLLALQRLGKRAMAVGADRVPRSYRFLPMAEQVRVTGELPLESWDTAVVLDCADPERAGDAWPLAQRAEKLINIDHHVTNIGYGDLNLVDPGASATSELVYSLVRELGIEVDRDMADCLFTGIMTDTGSFRYANASPRTFRIAAELMEAGASPEVLASSVWESRSIASLRLLARALTTLKLSDDGRMAWLTVDDAALAETGADEQEVEGFVNYPRSLEGVEVAILFRPMADGRTRVALRSKGRADVSRVAHALGGGGHPRAAGCVLTSGLDGAVDRVLAAARQEVSS
ncbi:MAG TPA: bifunctional oligoribonuclease/PAP phosphatase NrnA [Bacillota bacterium]|nr:bifunctional oligoribonuclease/PAP phosphatase NrnA [Bacillota bacterium]